MRKRTFTTASTALLRDSFSLSFFSFLQKSMRRKNRLVLQCSTFGAGQLIIAAFRIKPFGLQFGGVQFLSPSSIKSSRYSNFGGLPHSYQRVLYRVGDCLYSPP